MNFKQIEVIFLVAFLALNLFLFRIYQQGVMEATKIESINTTSESIENRLAQDGIKVEKALPFSKKVEEGAYVSGEATPFSASTSSYSRTSSEDKLYVNLPNNISAGIDVKNPQDVLSKLVENGQEVAYGSEYVYNRELSNSTTQIVYVQKWRDIIFMDETAQLSILSEKSSDNFLSYHYDQAHIENIEFLREKQKTCSEEEAIVTLYNSNKIPSESTIKWTKLAYTRIFKVNGKNVYIPAWFIGIQTAKNSIQIERVNALTKSVLSSNISEVQND